MNYIPYFHPNGYLSFLQLVRRWKGKSQKEFAASLGISRPYLSQIETGYYRAPERLLLRIASSFKIDLDLLQKKIIEHGFPMREGIRFSNAVAHGREET